MKIIELNTVPYGSTGKIAASVAKLARERGHEAVFALGWTKKKKNHADAHEWIAAPFASKALHEGISRITGLDGFCSPLTTKRFIEKMKAFQPDIVHLHMIHSCFLNLPMLFEYLKNTNIKVFWTFHDCWAFTGGCPYFDCSGCNRWIEGCRDCQYSRYTFDFSRYIWNKKKEVISSVRDMTIITPSRWLAELAMRSEMIGGYSTVEVIHNGIDLNIFKPSTSDFRERYHCEEKFLLLGVSLGWEDRKGLDVFIELAHMLDKQYQIVLVGTNDNVDRRLPPNIISIHRTADQTELAQIYTAADIFLNPTREDNFPTVNIEALACGTPVITFNTGGSPEAIDESCGAVTADKTAESMKKDIEMVRETPFAEEACLRRAAQFRMEDCFQRYIDLYERVERA